MRSLLPGLFRHPLSELYLEIAAQGREGLGLAFRTELGTFMALNS
jgi:hypothetical protein